MVKTVDDDSLRDELGILGLVQSGHEQNHP